MSIRKIAGLLTERAAEYGHPIYILADEPYRDLVYDGDAVPYIPGFYPDTIYCYSFSKSLSLPGERVGYLAVPPESKDRAALRAAISGAGRMLGVCLRAGALSARVRRVPRPDGELREYKKNRDLICEGLAALGFSLREAAGGVLSLRKITPEEDARAFLQKRRWRTIFCSCRATISPVRATPALPTAYRRSGCAARCPPLPPSPKNTA